MNIDISNGELIDKVTILSLKLKHINDNDKLLFVNKEYELLVTKMNTLIDNNDMKLLYNHLLSINSQLWDVEDKLRRKEFDKVFDSEFIGLARSVYFLNDERSKIKRKIDNITNSEIQEVKQYITYNN
jgi:hypothetical protein